MGTDEARWGVWCLRLRAVGSRVRRRRPGVTPLACHAACDRRRRTFGKALIEHPVIRQKFAEMARQARPAAAPPAVPLCCAADGGLIETSGATQPHIPQIEATQAAAELLTYQLKVLPREKARRLRPFYPRR